MARNSKRKTRRAPGEGTEWYDATTRQWRWRIRWQGEDHTVADRDRARATEERDRLREQLKKQVRITDGKQTLAEFFPQFQESIRRDVSDSTYRDYEKRYALYIAAPLGGKRLCDLAAKPAIIRRWLNATRDNYAFSSAKQARALLERILDLAVADKLIEENPARLVKPPRPPKQIPTDDDEEGQRALTVEQVDRLLTEAKRIDKLWSSARGLSQAAANAVRGNGTYVLYVLAVRLGLRRGELLGLRWKDVDFERKIIRVRQQVIRNDEGYHISSTLKTPSSRRDLPLEDDIAELLHHVQAKLGERASVKDLVFPDKDGNERDPQSVTRNFSRLVKRLDLGNFHLHDLRHTAITRWRTRGVDLEVAAALAGHEKADVTANIYSEKDMDRKRAALKQAS